MSAPRRIALVALGQSNMQGAARLWNGGPSLTNRDRHVSRATGETDPFPGSNNSNQGGSLFPYLIDYGMSRGVRFHVFNYAIGGASVFQYTGRVGGTVTGDPATPAAAGFFSGGEYSGGTTVCVEGDGDFDPFGLLARSRAVVTSLLGKYEAVVSLWSNGESDAGSSTASYQAGLTSVANYMLASGVRAHLIGLTCRIPSASLANYDLLEAGQRNAVTAFQAVARPVFDGANAYRQWIGDAPLYAETDGATRVHLTLRGQQIHARLWNDALRLAGY